METSGLGGAERWLVNSKHRPLTAQLFSNFNVFGGEMLLGFCSAVQFGSDLFGHKGRIS